MADRHGDIVHVVLASDAAASAGLAVAGYSAIKHTSRPVAMWVIQDGLDMATLDALRKFWSGAVEVNFLKMKRLPWWWATDKFPLLAWARIEVGELLPARVSRCVYLDTDTLVNRDLAELADRPMNGNPIAMVLNDKITEDVLPYLHSIGLEPGRWFNSGVALIDVDSWRRNSVMRELIRCKRSMPPMLWFPDQDLINKYFAGRILELEPCWNRRDAAHSPQGQILHFAGSTKPWDMAGDNGFVGLKAWREVYALWGRRPTPKRLHKIKMLAASVIRRTLSMTQPLRRIPQRLQSAN